MSLAGPPRLIPPIYGPPPIRNSAEGRGKLFLTPMEFDGKKFPPPYKDPPPIRDFGGSNGQKLVPYRGGVVGAPIGCGTPTTAGSSTPSVRPPRGVRDAALGRTRFPKGGWRLWSGAVVGGCWVGTGASPALLTRARPFPWGPSRQAGPPVHLLACRRATVQGRFPSGPLGGPRGIPSTPLHVPVYRSRIGRCRCHRGVPCGGTLRGRGRSRLCWGIRT